MGCDEKKETKKAPAAKKGSGRLKMAMMSMSAKKMGKGMGKGGK